MRCRAGWRLGALALAVIPAWLGPAHAQGRTPAGVPEINLFAFTNGALIAQTSSNYGGEWDALWLLTDAPTHGWASAQNAEPPFEIVIALAERSELRRLEFDTTTAETVERAAKDIDVYISDESASAGFKPFDSVTLEPEMDEQGVTAPQFAVGRWVKLVVKGNHGDSEYTELTSVHGFGVPLVVSPTAHVAGTWDSETYGRMHLTQDGDKVHGCYEFHGGLVEGSIDAHLMRLQWTEEDKQTGPALMVLHPDTVNFTGLWRVEDATEWTSGWDLHKVSDEIGTCPASAKGG